MYTEYKVQRITKALQYHVILLGFFHRRIPKYVSEAHWASKLGKIVRILFAAPICVSVDEAEPFQITVLFLSKCFYFFIE